jgi:hypothetical protein
MRRLPLSALPAVACGAFEPSVSIPDEDETRGHYRQSVGPVKDSYVRRDLRRQNHGDERAGDRILHDEGG